MNEVDKTTDLSYDLTFQLLLTTWLLLAFNTCMYFSRHCYTCSSLSSLAQLDSGCVCACSCAGMCIYACQSLKWAIPFNKGTPPMDDRAFCLPWDKNFALIPLGQTVVYGELRKIY